MHFKKHEVVINGRKTFYWQKNTAQKKVAVLLHGFPGNHRVIIDMASNLKDFRLVVPDMPACGQSDSFDKEHVLQNYAKWLNNFLETLSIEKPIIIGYSFGSRVATTFCDLYEKKVRGLVLITPVVRADSLVARVASIEYEIAEILPNSFKKMWLGNRVYKTASNLIVFKSSSKKRREKLIAIDKEEASHLNPKATIEIFEELFKARPISEGRKINTKTLLIAANKDEIATVKSVKELSGRFLDSELIVVKNSGHILPGERPKRTASIIQRWLGSF